MSHSPPSTHSHNHRKSWPKRIESCLCKTCSFFPLTFVYGLTTWALITEIRISFLDDADVFALAKAILGVALYALANVSYSVAVWTGPGSPLDERRSSGGGGKKGGYEGLPVYEDDGLEDGGNATPHGHASGGAAGVTTVTAKSTGKQRFCKKCHTDKPDRTHHCSTCGRCVLKMDHHCPWLATCVGLRNYKPFLLFLTYTCLFCWTCFAVTGSWVWAAISNDSRITSKGESAVVNCILLAVLSGIIGLVLTGFTAWHMWLVTRGETTIESLEKTRYLNPLRKNLERRDHRRDEEQQHPNTYDEEGSEARENQSLLDQLKETHANALPGVLRPEEGESTPNPSSSPTPQPPAPASSSDSPAKSSLQQSYASLEQQREQDRYDRYLDEVSNQQLPNAFDLGWRRNPATRLRSLAAVLVSASV